MRVGIRISSSIALVLALSVAFTPARTFAADPIRGGRLYDRWWAITGAPAPDGRHPLYPESGQASGSSTFRCKECHGWDYKGVDGAYGSGSHFTGIVGVAGSTLSAEEMFAIIKNPPGDGGDGTTANGHDYGALGLPDRDVDDLVEFLQSALIDPDEFLDADVRFVGDPVEGGLNYTVFGGCFACHGEDGTAIDFGSPDDPEWVGTIALKNPWEFMHKVRFGEPDSAPPMPSWIQSGGSTQGVADLGRYVQDNFPAAPEPDGGRQVPGDCNQDGVLDISDAMCELNFLFSLSEGAFPCGDDDAGRAGSRALLDWQEDGAVDIKDAVNLLVFLFDGGFRHALATSDSVAVCVPIPGCPDNVRCN